MTSRGEDPKHSTTTTTTPKHPSTTNPYQDEIIQGHGPAIPMTAMNLSYLDFEFFSDEEDDNCIVIDPISNKSLETFMPMETSATYQKPEGSEGEGEGEEQPVIPMGLSPLKSSHSMDSYERISQYNNNGSPMKQNPHLPIPTPPNSPKGEKVGKDEIEEEAKTVSNEEKTTSASSSQLMSSSHLNSSQEPLVISQHEQNSSSVVLDENTTEEAVREILKKLSMSQSQSQQFERRPKPMVMMMDMSVQTDPVEFIIVTKSIGDQKLQSLADNHHNIEIQTDSLSPRSNVTNYTQNNPPTPPSQKSPLSLVPPPPSLESLNTPTRLSLSTTVLPPTSPNKFTPSIATKQQQQHPQPQPQQSPSSAATQPVSTLSSNIILTEEDMKNLKISFMNFAIGDIALFVPTDERKTVWMAFHSNRPYRYLAQESLENFLAKDRQKLNSSSALHKATPVKERARILGRIIFMETFIANDETNPYNLPKGTMFYVCYIEPLLVPKKKA